MDIEGYIQTNAVMEELFFDEGVHLRTLTEGAFLLPHKRRSKKEQAIDILHVLFKELVPYRHFRSFVEQIPSAKEQTAFLSCLLYHIFSLTFPLKHLRSPEELEAYLVRILATGAKDRTIASVWQRATLTQKAKIAAFTHAHYDEGSFQLFRHFDEPFKTICHKIQHRLITPTTFWEWAQAKRTISEKELTAFVAEQEREVTRRIERLHSLLDGAYSKSHICKFVTIFGLYGHQVPFDADVSEDASLDEKFHLEPFRERLLAHLNALSDPNRYHDGLKKIIYAIPTCGRDLEKMPSLVSLLDGFKMIGSGYTVYVFDQSMPEQFAKNARYVKRLQKEFKTKIEHLDKERLIALAQQHGLHDLIVTGPNEQFGYAGARNAIFLLGPLLHGDKNGFVMMCDDDLLVPASNLFSDALFCHEHKNSYFSRFGYISGRVTTEVFSSLDPQIVLTQANRILSQCGWSNRGMLHYMSTLLSSPKVCVNVPLGQEENHFLALKTYDFDFRKPAIHLAGWRYPKGGIPTNRYSGLMSHLESLNRYVFGLLMVAELLDPSDVLKRCALVWNGHKKPFSSLKEAIAFICKQDTKKAMQDKFWKNVDEYIAGFNDTGPYDETKLTPSSRILEVLVTSDFDAVIAKHCELHDYAYAFKKELREMKAFFEKMAREARYLKAFSFDMQELRKNHTPFSAVEQARKNIEKISGLPIEKHYFTYAFYTLCRKVGCAEFQEALQSAQVENSGY